MQYNLPDFHKNISYSAHRSGLSGRFSDPDVQKSVESVLRLAGKVSLRAWSGHRSLEISKFCRDKKG